MANLTSSQIKDSYQSVLTTSETTSNPTTGTLQNGKGTAITTLTVSGTVNATTLGGTLSTASQPNVTSVGTLSSLTSSGTVTATGLTSTSGNILAPAGKGIAFSGDETRIMTPEDNVSGALLNWGAAGMCRFVQGSTERMRITSDASAYLRLASGTAGIQFNGDTAAANALDDYEEGTWTPTITHLGGAGAASYTIQDGRYTKIGRLVVLEFSIQFTKNTLSGGVLIIADFPFVVGGTLSQNPVLIDNLATALNNPLTQVSPTNSYAFFIDGNGSTVNHAGLDINTYLSAVSMNARGTIIYST